MNSKGTQLYIYIHPFSRKLPSHPCCHVTSSRVSHVLHSRSFLISHFKCSSVHMLISNSLPVPFSHPSCLVTVSSFSKSALLSPCFLPHIVSLHLYQSLWDVLAYLSFSKGRFDCLLMYFWLLCSCLAIKRHMVL